MSIEKLLNERQKTHGEAWHLTGRVLGMLYLNLVVIMTQFPEYAFAWIMILNKLVRALQAPDEIDHWRDIAGYAQLVVNNLDVSNGGDNDLPSK